MSRKKVSRFIVDTDGSGNGVIRTKHHYVNGLWRAKNGPYILGFIFWSGESSNFYTVELRDRDPLGDDSAFFIAGTADSFDAAVALAEEVLAESLVVV